MRFSMHFGPFQAIPCSCPEPGNCLLFCCSAVLCCLCQQTPSHTWRFIGGEYFNESISYGIKYADFMFKLSEKFRAAVSVKYQAPGEELDPDSLISVQDDADLQVSIHIVTPNCAGQRSCKAQGSSLVCCTVYVL
eukprot:GHRR01025545.1.p1 GENE.GHRR01025545.1~~GHRR01025545.1.p1  ORF type:complete len:135 (-),score=28.88 GHRR01025545.1:297-701(-)